MILQRGISLKPNWHNFHLFRSLSVTRNQNIFHVGGKNTTATTFCSDNQHHLQNYPIRRLYSSCDSLSTNVRADKVSVANEKTEGNDQSGPWYYDTDTGQWKMILMAGCVIGSAVLLQYYGKNSTYAKHPDANSSEGEVGPSSLVPDKPPGPPTDKSSVVRCHDNGVDRRLSLDEAITISRDIAQRVKDESGCPGLVIAVSVDGHTVWAEGLGYADVENRVPCTPATVLRIASISKSITMTTVAKLWESGDLDLDEPIQHYLPDYPEKTWNGEKVTITTRHLLSHLSGIRHYSKDYMNKPKDESSQETQPQPTSIQSKSSVSNLSNQSKDSNMNKPNSNQSNPWEDEMKLKEYHIKKKYDSVTESLKLFKDDPLVHKPGTKYLYTTHGWTVVSAIVEAVAKVKFETYLRTMLTDLGMDNTYLEEERPLIYNRGRHYEKDKKGKLVNSPYVDLSYKWAGGGLISNVLDLVKFGNIMLYCYQGDSFYSNQNIDKARSSKNDAKNVEGVKVPSNGINESVTDNKDVMPGYLRPETMQKLWTGVDNTKVPRGTIAGESYGLGWGVWKEKQTHGLCRHQKFFVSHTGGAVGGSSVLLILPSNTREYHSDVNQGRPLHGNFNNSGLKQTSQSEESQSNNNGLKLTPNEELQSINGQPKGVVVTIIVNMISVSLNKSAFDIAKTFDRLENR